MNSDFKQKSLDYHKFPFPGKMGSKTTVRMENQQDISYAYSPGVAEPCREIALDESLIFDYTNKANFVVVISNGTAVLGLGNIGAAAAKPVMEGKSALFKKFANIDSVDIEIKTQNIDEFITTVSNLGTSFGGINLEDIKSPDCFIIEEKLKEIMDIPVFHDDQHGTAIILAAGLLNALEITKKDIKKIKIVINGPGAAGIACGKLLQTMGINPEQMIYCDQAGVVYKGRETNMNPWKEKIAIETTARTLEEAITNADVFVGLSVKGALKQEFLKKMRGTPIIFALANPDPEIEPEDVYKIFPEAIVATGRSDYKNQINNVMGFPYIFRGALDVRATKINEEMKIAAVKAIADLAKEPVPEEVMHAYNRTDMIYGPNYIIPMPFDRRLFSRVSTAVAQAAIETGVARKPINNLQQYQKKLETHHDPTYNILDRIYSKIKGSKKRLIFAEGEEESIIRAANYLLENDLCVPILIGEKDKVIKKMHNIGICDTEKFEIMNAAMCQHNDLYIDYLYQKLKREGRLWRDCNRAVKTKRNFFSACMLACGHGDGLISGVTRTYAKTLRDLQTVLFTENQLVFGMAMLFSEEKVLFIADTNVFDNPTPQQFAQIAIQAAQKVNNLGRKARVAFVSHSTFGSRVEEQQTHNMRETVQILKKQNVDFEFDGEMAISTALNEKLRHDLYPFCNLSDNANILIMPNLHTANIAYKLLIELSEFRAIGPFLIGMNHPVQIAQIGASEKHIINSAIWAIADAME